MQPITEKYDTLNQQKNVLLSIEDDFLDRDLMGEFDTRKFSQSSNAIAIVIPKIFNSGFINEPLGLIEGRVAGLSIVKAGDNPNESFDARIRGLSNIHGDTKPTIIIDGVIDDQLENLDPNDIESFEIIKDVAATAIYGIRGANGVIIINTKRGINDQSRVSYNTYLNFEKGIRQQPIMNRDEWVSFSNELEMNNNRFGSNTDWYDEILQTGISNVHNLAISGGSAQNDFYVAVNYRKVNGILRTTGFDRFNTRINLNQKALNNKLTLGINVAGTLNKALYGDNNAFEQAAKYNPTAPVKNDDPLFEPYGGYFQEVLFQYQNPVALLEQNENNGTDKRFSMQLNAEYKLVKNLKVDVLYSLQTINNLQNKYKSKQSLAGGFASNGLAEKISNNHYNQLFQLDLNWKEKIGNGSFNVVGGYAYQYYMSEGFNAIGGDFITDAYKYHRLGAAGDFNDGRGQVDSYKNSNKIIGFFGRADFEWQNKYFVSLVSRYDGSSLFGENEKWGLYPGISAAVDFAKVFLLEKINQLKLRLGTGKAGQNIHLNHLPVTQLKPSGGTIFYNGKYIPTYDIYNIGDPNIKAPAKTEWNIGLDFDLFHGKVFGSLDYYKNTVKDLLLEYSIPSPPNLIQRKWYNMGELKNAGLEFSIYSNLVTKNDFSYSPSFIISRYLENSFGSLSDPSSDLEFMERSIGYVGAGCSYGLIKIEENAPIGNFWGPTYGGISTNGEWVFKEQGMNDDYIDYESYSVIGNGLPNVELGFGNNFRYRKWDLNLFFKGAFGHSLINQYRLQNGSPQLLYLNNALREVREMKNQNGTYLQEYPRYSSYFVEKGNYFKLANFDLGYNIDFNNESAISDLRIYLTGNNFMVLSSYSGSDPEIRYAFETMNYSAITSGIDQSETWLMTRSVALGLRVGF